jgi:hypothetical protein
MASPIRFQTVLNLIQKKRGKTSDISHLHFGGRGGCAMEQILGEIYIFSFRYLNAWGLQSPYKTQMNIQTQFGRLFRS